MDKQATGKRAESQVERALWLYSVLIALLTAASWGIYEWDGDYLMRPLFLKTVQFSDLTDFIGKTAHLYHDAAHLGSGSPIFPYPAPAAFVYKALIYAVPGHEIRTYLVFLALCLVSFGIVAWRAVRGSTGVKAAAGAALLVTAVLGFPMWLTADRGNIEGVVWALVATALCLLLRRHFLFGSILIGAAASIKPFSLLYLLLLLVRRQFKDTAAGVLTMCIVLSLTLVYLGPNPIDAYRDLKPGIVQYTARYLTNLAPIQEIRFDHSLLDSMKATALTVEMGGPRPHKAIDDIERLRAEPGGWQVTRLLIKVYPFVALVAFGLIVVGFYNKPFLNQLIAVAVMVTLLPPSQADYTLLHLYVPFGAFMVYLTREVAQGLSSLRFSSMLMLATLFALLLSPLSFLLIYAAAAKTLLLIALLVVAARSPMLSSYFDGIKADNSVPFGAGMLGGQAQSSEDPEVAGETASALQ